jgi:4-diphosphocytidyl-2-C-methyl-D-erythritol kinase
VTGVDPLRRLTPVVRVAPAKLNLTLAVIGRRPDGYHDLHSVMAPLALADLISLVPTASGPDRLHVAGADVGAGPDNLVLRAVAALRPRLGRHGDALPPLAIRLEKRIPVAAGLGGGSSDAAAAIDGALEAWGVELDGGARAEVAASVGSDVPFFLAHSPALVSGRGEEVHPLQPPSGSPLGVLLVTPAVPLSTAAVYGAFPGGSGSTRLTSQHLAGELAKGLSAQGLYERAGILASANDLAAAAATVAPELVPFRRRLTRVLGRPVGQSGSGPTLWVLYPSPAAAREAAAAVGRSLADGTLPQPGDAPPRAIATTFAAPAAQPRREERPV